MQGILSRRQVSCIVGGRDDGEAGVGDDGDGSDGSDGDSDSDSDGDTLLPGSSLCTAFRPWCCSVSPVAVLWY